MMEELAKCQDGLVVVAVCVAAFFVGFGIGYGLGRAWEMV